MDDQSKTRIDRSGRFFVCTSVAWQRATDERIKFMQTVFHKSYVGLINYCLLLIAEHKKAEKKRPNKSQIEYKTEKWLLKAETKKPKKIMNRFESVTILLSVDMVEHSRVYKGSISYVIAAPLKNENEEKKN